jgi:hypothetical protein
MSFTDLEISRIVTIVGTLRGLGSGPSIARAKAEAALMQFGLTEKQARFISSKRHRRLRRRQGARPDRREMT